MATKPDYINSISCNLNEIHFSDIFDLKELQRLQDLFSDVHGVASVITTSDGKPITKPSGFTRLCSNVIRKTRKGRDNCFKSDAAIGKQNSTGPIVQPCLSCGLWDAGASITVGGKHIANWLIGQVRNEELDIEHMIQYADEIGAHRLDFIEAMKEVPIMPLEQFKKVSKMLFAFANELSDKAYNNYQLKIQITEREKVTDALRISEERYRSILSASPDNIMITDLEGRIRIVSHEGLNMFGYKNESDFLGHLITEFIVPEDRERAFSNVALKLHGTKSWPGEYLGMRADGSIFDIEANAEFIFDNEGQPIQLVFIVRDITERKKAESNFKQSEEAYRLLTENASDVIWTMNLEGKYQYISPSVFKMTGYTAQENKNQYFVETLMPESARIAHQLLKDACERILSRERTDPLMLNLEQICRNGSTIWTEINIEAIYDDSNFFKYFLGVTRDITKRIKTEEELRESENQKAAILRAIPDLLFLFNQNGDYLEVYSGDNLKFAGAKEATIGKNIRDFFPSDVVLNAIEAFQKCSQNMEFEQLSYSMIVNGKTEFYEARIVPATDGNALAIVRDITEQKLAKETLATQNDALLKLNQFSIELSALSSESNLEAFIARRIKEFTGASVVVFSEYCAENRTLSPKHIEMESGLLKKMMSLIGNKIEILDAVISEEVYEMMTRSIIGIYRDLNELTFGTITNQVGTMVQALLKADRFIAVTYLIEGQVYGTSLLAMGKHQPDPSIEMLKNFVFLASVSLRRKRAEELLLLSEQTYRGILDSISEAVYIVDKNGVFLDVNQAATKMYGYSKNEIVGQTPAFLSAPHSNDLSQIEIYLKKAFNGEPQSFEFWGQRKDGTSFPKDVNISPGYYFGKPVNIAVSRDITQRLQSEEKFKMLAHAIRSISESVSITDLTDKILFVNSAFMKTYQYDEQELVGNWVNMIRSPNNSVDLVGEILPLTLNGGWQGELMNQRKDGSEFPVFISTSIVYDEKEKPVAVIAVATDITERKQRRN